MSLRALLEIVVHLESFRNIDLFFQGLYYVKVSVYNKKNDEVSNTMSNILNLYSSTMPILTVYSLPRFHKRSKGNSRM